MSEPFTIGITRDFLDAEGRLTYKEIGLRLLEAEPGVRARFLDENRSPVTPEQIRDLDAALALGTVWNSVTFAEGAERLLIVARFGVGYDNCDVSVMTRSHVLLTLAVGATDVPVAGGVLALMLALSRRLFVKDRLVREGRWAERGRYQGTELTGKTLGIVGLGGAGRALRRLVEPFGMRVLAYDPFVSEEAMAALNVRKAELNDLFAEADYVSVHCLLNDATRGLIGREQFARMKPSAYFLNAARGPIVREPDLIEALREGRIAGAGLDVFEEEPPPPDNPLLEMENVILTPHAVCWTDECFEAIGETAIRSILAVRRGERPAGLVNPEVWERPEFQRKLARWL